MRYLSSLRRDLILTKLLDLGGDFYRQDGGWSSTIQIYCSTTILLLFDYSHATLLQSVGTSCILNAIGFMEQYRTCAPLVFQLRD